VTEGIQRPLRLSFTILILVLASFGVGVAEASAQPIFEAASVDLTEEGAFQHQAGAHPDLSFDLTPVQVTRIGPNGPYQTPAEELRDVVLDLPPGLVGNATAVPTCSEEDLTFEGEPVSNCPVGAQVGVANIRFGSYIAAGAPSGAYPVYNMQHGSGTPALFGFNYLGYPTLIEAKVRPEDYGVSSGTVGVTQAETIAGVELTIWGVPASPSHDGERASREPGGGNALESGKSVRSEAPLLPFLSNPTSCPGSSASFLAHADTWETPGVFDERTLGENAEGTPFVFEGCSKLRFEPSITAHTTSASADSPSGLSVDLRVPQSEAPGGLATSQVRSVGLTLPKGMSVSPSSAAGLGACSEAEVGLKNATAPSCPESSRIGSVQIKTPLLEEELEGGMYLARQRENPFGSLLAVYLIAKGPGFWLKLPGKVATDPQTGQVSVSFDDNPQLPFEELKVDLKAGPAAPLQMPRACGTYGITSEITPWSGSAPVVSEAKFTVSQGCGGGFSPGFRAGTAKPQAGSFSPFTLQVTRQDGEQNLARIQATLPPGLLAKLKGVPLCPDAQAATGDCPAASQVGTTTIGAGPGSNPIYVPEAGKAPTAVYLGGPYNGAPYSLIVKVPAQSGPFDLGTVVVRNALQVDPFTTQVTAVSDPLPQILEGIPISYRDVRVEVDRPEFTVNPTNCSQFAVTSILTAATGQTSSPQAPFAAANCERLNFEPGLKLQLKGNSKRLGLPAIKAVLTYPKKGSFANIKRAQVNLPPSMLLEQNNIAQACTKTLLLAGKCTSKSIYGRAKAYSSLLDNPLTGPVYLVGGFGYKLPALVADLDGQIHVILKAKVDSGPNHGLRTTFEGVPDAPVERFVLQLKGGPKYGLLENSENLCKAKQVAGASFTSQSGQVLELPTTIANSCKGGKKKPGGGKPKGGRKH
jgi:hypothetical protein